MATVGFAADVFGVENILEVLIRVQRSVQNIDKGRFLELWDFFIFLRRVID